MLLLTIFVSIKNNMAKKRNKFQEAVVEAELPFDLLSGFQCVVDEVVSKGFEYKSLNRDHESQLSFDKGKDERVIISVHEDTLTVRHFDLEGESRKLRVLYVVKPTQRIFNLL